MHEQVCIKVNACVDKAIAPLIEALSSIEGVVTMESCQEWFPKEACVLFYYGFNLTDWEALGRLCFGLAEKIRKYSPDSGCIVSLEWQGNNDQPWGRLVVRPEYIGEVTDALCKLSVVVGSG